MYDVPSPASDVWAFAVLMYYLVSVGLFPSHSNCAKLDEVLAEMVPSLGRLPECWWQIEGTILMIAVGSGLLIANVGVILTGG